MTVTDELNAWIAEHGSCRDALNVALARLRLALTTIADLEAENIKLFNQLNVGGDRKLEPVDRMVKVNGVIFHCDCGCNVFRHPVDCDTEYICNACGALYLGEKVTPPE